MSEMRSQGRTEVARARESGDGQFIQQAWHGVLYGEAVVRPAQQNRAPISGQSQVKIPGCYCLPDEGLYTTGKGAPQRRRCHLLHAICLGRLKLRHI